MSKQTISLKQFNATSWLYIFILVHLSLWTFIPALIRRNLPLDAIEGTIWGHQLEWGYDKNPFLNGWLTALATHLGGQTGWMVYLFSQLSVIACFWAVWQIAKKMLPHTYALVSVLILETIQYFNFHAIDFNDNTLELGLWALSIYYFYEALTEQNSRRVLIAWLATAFFSAFALMAKYYTLALFAGMALFLLSTPENRKHLQTWPPYFALGLFLSIITPHVIWLFYHNFITVQYVFERGSSIPRLTNHIYFPFQFAWQQLETFSPALILMVLLALGKKDRENSGLSDFNKAFLFFVGLGPFLLTLLLSLLCGTKLRAGWGMPLLSLWGIILVATLKPHLSKNKIIIFLCGIFILMGGLLSGYIVSLIDSSDPSTANFPGRRIANTLTQQWHDTYQRPLKFVAGSRWVGGNIGFYSKDHPAVFIEWDREKAPWINIARLKQHGGIFVWDLSRHETLPKDIKAEFPNLGPTQIMTFAWQRNIQNLPPIQVGVAFLPPSSD